MDEYPTPPSNLITICCLFNMNQSFVFGKEIKHDKK